MKLRVNVLAGALLASPVLAQSNDPYSPIRATEDVVRVDLREFATLPDIDGVAARMMLLVQEPGTRNLFVSDMRGPLYRISADGKTVTQYVNIDDPRWNRDVQSQGRERGFQSFAFHPQFHQAGVPGFGKFYTWSDVTDTLPGGGLHADRPGQHARYRAARVDREDAGSRDVRR